MNRIYQYLSLHVADYLLPVVWAVVKVVILLVLSRILIILIHKVIGRVLQINSTRINDRRRNTLDSLLTNVARYAVFFVFGLMALQSIGFQITTLLAGAGIAGVAIGLGAKNIIQDVLSGFFILFEDQYGVGDVVQIGQFKGTVISIGLRLTQLKMWTGEIVTVPNGEITQVVNFSRANSVGIVDVGVAYDTSIDHAIRLLEEILADVQERERDVVSTSVQGVIKLDPSSVVLRVTLECMPLTHFPIQRALQKTILETFQREGIEIPFPQMVVTTRETTSLPG